MRLNYIEFIFLFGFLNINVQKNTIDDGKNKSLINRMLLKKNLENDRILKGDIGNKNIKLSTTKNKRILKNDRILRRGRSKSRNKRRRKYKSNKKSIRYNYHKKIDNFSNLFKWFIFILFTLI